MKKVKAEKNKYRMRPTSDANFISCLLSFLSTILLGVIFWPIFTRFFQKETNVTLAMVIFYGVLIGCLLLYSLLNWIAGRKFPALAATLSVPITLIFLLDVTGLRHIILFFQSDNLLVHYRNNAEYYKRLWPFIAALGVLTVLGFLFYLAICYGGSKTKALPLVFSFLSALGWVAFGCWRIYSVDYASYLAGDIVARTLIYTVLFYVAAIFYFISQFVVISALHKRSELNKNALVPPLPDDVAAPVYPDSNFASHTVEIEPALPATTGAVHDTPNDLAAIAATRQDSSSGETMYRPFAQEITASEPENYPR